MSSQDDARAWSPKELPADDPLGREPAPEDLALIEEPAAVEAAETPVAETPVAETPAAEAPVAEAPGDDPVDVARILADLPTAPEVAPAAKNDEGPWTTALVGLVMTAFLVFAPVQVIVGGVLPWAATFAVGAALAIWGGRPVIRGALSRGTVPSAHLAALVGGLVILVACGVVSAVGAQGLGS